MQARIVFLTALLSIGLVCPVLAAPSTSAASAVLMDGDTGRILYAQDENTPRPMASTTKLMTALVAVESLGGDLARPVKIQPEWTGIEGTSLYLKPGEILQAETLLYGLLLHSGNDAAVALAGYCAGDVETFVGWMNQRAADLGMTNTHFSDPNGLGDENHCASALDMAKLGQACLQNDTIAHIVSTRSITLEGRALTNHNKLLWQYDSCTGMKTGYTRQAGRTLVSSAQRDGQNLICVTLNDRDDWADHKALFDYGFSTYPRRVLAQAGEAAGQVPVTGSLLHSAPVEVRDTVAYPLAEGESVTVEKDLPAQMETPLKQGEIAGTIRFLLNGKEIGRSYLVWSYDIQRETDKVRVAPSLRDLLGLDKDRP